MDTVTISKKKYRELIAAKARLDALSNVNKGNSIRKPRESFADLRGALSDVEAFKGKTSVEVQHMIRDIWSEKNTN